MRLTFHSSRVLGVCESFSIFRVDRESAEKLAKVVESACVLLADYNGRLSAELEDRTAVCKMLRAYLSSQQRKVTDCDQRIEVRN